MGASDWNGSLCLRVLAHLAGEGERISLSKDKLWIIVVSVYGLGVSGLVTRSGPGSNMCWLHWPLQLMLQCQQLVCSWLNIATMFVSLSKAQEPMFSYRLTEATTQCCLESNPSQSHISTASILNGLGVGNTQEPHPKRYRQPNWIRCRGGESSTHAGW